MYPNSRRRSPGRSFTAGGFRGRSLMTPLFAASSKGPSARIPAATAKSSLNPGLRLAASRAWRGMPRASGGALADSVNLAVADSVNLATVRLSVCRAGPLEIPPGSGWRRSRRKGTTRPPRTFQGTAGAAAGVICRCWTQGPSCQRTTRRCGPGVRTYHAHRPGSPAGEPAPAHRCRPPRAAQRRRHIRASHRTVLGAVQQRCKAALECVLSRCAGTAVPSAARPGNAGSSAWPAET